jgi:hypothetical protein
MARYWWASGHCVSSFVRVGTNPSCRPSGCSKPTCTTWPAPRTRLPSRHVAASTTASSASCSGLPSPSDARRSRRTFCPSRYCPVWCWRALQPPFSLHTPGPWRLRRRESQGPSRTSSRTMCRRQRWGGARQWLERRRASSNGGAPRGTQIQKTAACPRLHRRDRKSHETLET